MKQANNIKPVPNKKYIVSCSLHGTMAKDLQYSVEASSKREAITIARGLVEEASNSPDLEDMGDWDTVVRVDHSFVNYVEEAV